jgi:NADPH:quinone reductase-like Zn-dependent oxidoreductase
MRKVRVHAAGGYGRLRVENAEDPQPGAGEVAIDVQAAGVNYADCLVRMGLYTSARQYVGWPITPGFEVSGTVAAVGPGVREVGVGDPVLGVTRFGGYASRLVVPERHAFPRPRGWTAEQAAGFPTVHLTAWYALVELANVRRGRRVLVHSAAGGVGTALLQLGKIKEATMVGVVGGSHKVETARRFGADEVVDKSRRDLWGEAGRHAPGGYDVVLDANGAETLRGSYRHLAPGGRLVVYGFHTMLPRRRGRPRWGKLAKDFVRTPRFDPLEMTNSNRSVLAFNLSYMFHEGELLGEAMGELLQWAEQGWLQPPSVRTFGLDEVGAAHEALESGQTVGKLVLCP